MTGALITGPLPLVMLGIAAGALIVMAIFLAAIWRRQTDADQLLDALRDTVTGMKSDQRFYLTAGNLGPLHEKVNAMGTDVAELRGDMRATREQLKMISDYLRNRP